MINPVIIGNAELWLGDCLEILPTLEKVDAVITDPPYGDDVHKAGKRTKKTGGIHVINTEALDFGPITDEMMTAVCGYLSNICRGWVLSFCQIEQIYQWRQCYEAAGIKWRRGAVWVKPDSPPQISGDRPAQGFESIAMGYAGSGKSVWNGGGKRAVYTHATRDNNTAKYHPTCKPENLMIELISLFSDHNDIVADPFMGSGTTGVACMNLGRKFIGIEIEKKYFDIACERIEQAQKQTRMFA